jgi:hypothetical protein
MNNLKAFIIPYIEPAMHNLCVVGHVYSGNNPTNVCDKIYKNELSIVLEVG